MPRSCSRFFIFGEEFEVVNFIELNEIIKDETNIKNSSPFTTDVIKKGDKLYIQRKNDHETIISPEFCCNVIKQIHDFGHIGLKQIEMKLSPFYFCSYLRKLITDFCLS